MGKKRKRPANDDQTRESIQGQQQQQQQSPKSSAAALHPTASHSSDQSSVSHPVISLYYRQLVTLRQYILQKIPRSSKSRRRRIAAVRNDGSAETTSGVAPQTQLQHQGLASLLDTTLVGVWKELSPADSQERLEDFIAHTHSQFSAGPARPQSDIVDHVIWALLNRGGFSYQRPQHLLSRGFQRARGPLGNNNLPCSIPNVEAYIPNNNVQILKQAPWTELLDLLGSSGDEIMLTLLLDCGLFMAVDAKKGIYCQISGLPLSTLEPIRASPQEHSICRKEGPQSIRSPSAPAPVAGTNAKANSVKVGEKNKQQGTNAIIFCRRRMLYARPHLSSNGGVELGLPNHVLNRFPSSDSLQQTVHVLKYIFPKQFGLENVFTAEPANRERALSKHFSSREDEIARKEALGRTRYQRGLRTADTTTGRQGLIKIPKRLRRKAVELVRQLQNRNKRCSYKHILHHYCPEEDTGPWTLGPLSAEAEMSASEPASSGPQPLITQLSFTRVESKPDQSKGPLSGNVNGRRVLSSAPKPNINLTDYATPAASVSAFCRAVIQRLIPPEFFGTGDQRIVHQKIILDHASRFIHMRRYENLSLHEVCEGIKITQIPWLEPQNLSQSGSEGKISASDFQKRRELFHEFVYYLFNSILMPLIRSNFYVTESQMHRNRLFYFRHDVWRRLTAQPLANLTSSMFEELTPERAEDILSERSLGYGSLRLLPKTTGIRPILNLRRRSLVKSTWAGKTRHALGSSVNSTIAPIHSMLNYEKRRRSDLLGSGMSSVGDIHSRLKAFKESMMARGLNQQAPLYFVKLDIQSCFDTIPQQNLMRVVEKLVSEQAYHFMKHVELRPVNEFNGIWPAREPEQSKMRRKFTGRMASTAKPERLLEAIANGSVTRRRNTVFIDTVARNEYSCDALLDLLNEHVQNNLVKIGKKYFRQRNGIPQGSVLSSFLCNLFYAEMERNVLGFLQTDEALLLRLVDDFLLVTLSSELAMRFLRVMIKGQPAYGISVNPAKSLVNFAASVDGAQIPRLVDTPLFPYCGSLIDTRTLEIFKDQDRILDGAESVTAALADSLTVESTRAPGRSFHRKVLASVKLSMQPMYLDTAHNSHAAVLSNLYTALITCAMKMYRYMRSLPVRAQPTPAVVTRTIRDVIQLAYRLIRARHQRDKQDRLPYSVTYSQMQYLSAAAFQFVLRRKQTRYRDVLRWLEGVCKEEGRNAAGQAALLAEAVHRGNSMYGGWRF